MDESLYEERCWQLCRYFCEVLTLTQQSLWNVATNLPHEAVSKGKEYSVTKMQYILNLQAILT
jgi:hypothetical protein